MRLYYLTFKKGHAVSDLLTWTNLRKLLSIKDINKRNYYINMCIKKNLSSRALEKEIKNNAFERLSLADKENIKLISDMKNFSIEMIRKTKTMTLQEYLKSDLAKERALHLDLSYRERYLEELHKAGLDGRLRPLKKE